jgi:hypothetical protein
MSIASVGTKTTVSGDDLCRLIEQLSTSDSYYFARWQHRVSGMVQDLGKVIPSPDGQVFDRQFELRWQQNDDQSYEVLLLHCEQGVENWDFQAIDSEWKISEPLGAYLYDKDETRFPKGFQYPKNLKLRQRYFQDAATATVHFVALTLVN